MINQLTEKEIYIISGGDKGYVGNLADWTTYFWAMEGAKNISKKIKEIWGLGESAEVGISYALFVTAKTAGYVAGIAVPYIAAKITNYRRPHVD